MFYFNTCVMEKTAVTLRTQRVKGTCKVRMYLHLCAVKVKSKSDYSLSLSLSPVCLIPTALSFRATTQNITNKDKVQSLYCCITYDHGQKTNSNFKEESTQSGILHDTALKTVQVSHANYLH